MISDLKKFLETLTSVVDAYVYDDTIFITKYWGAKMFNIQCDEQNVNECKNCVNYCICYNIEQEDWDTDYQYHYETFEGKQIFNSCFE